MAGARNLGAQHVRHVTHGDFGQGLAILVDFTELPHALISQGGRSSGTDAIRLGGGAGRWERHGLPDFGVCESTGIEDEFAKIDACTPSRIEGRRPRVLA